jgi:hypothetical protein
MLCLRHSCNEAGSRLVCLTGESIESPSIFENQIQSTPVNREAFAEASTTE